MADVPHGGRIVPVVGPRQLSTSSNTPSASSSDSAASSASSASSAFSDSSDDASFGLPEKPPQKQRSPRSTRSSRRKKAETECLELECLKELGLYALPTEGDGNCLYYALSDQVYGDVSHSDEIRIRLADHIAANKEYFMSFVAAVGGERRAPRRAAAVAAAKCRTSPSPANTTLPSAQAKEQSFESKVTESRKIGVWGGAEEIQAFCQSFKIDVNVYTEYGVQNFRDVHAPDTEERDVVHIAFHDFHHYSSVRHIHGPHTGLPGIPKIDKESEKEATTAAKTVVDLAPPWKISVIQENLGDKYERETIVEMLHRCRGNIDSAFLNLIGDDDTDAPPAVEAPASRAIMKSRLQPSSRESSPFSTGSKRSAEDSDSDENPRPASRRNRVRDQKKRILPDVTVGINFKDDQDDLVSLRLRVGPDTIAQKSAPRQTSEQVESDPGVATNSGVGSSIKNQKSRLREKVSYSEPPAQIDGPTDEPVDKLKPRRSNRINRTRNSSPEPI